MTSNDKQTDEFQDQSFKEQLDRVATERREDQQGTNTNPIVEKSMLHSPLGISSC